MAENSPLAPQLENILAKKKKKSTTSENFTQEEDQLLILAWSNSYKYAIQGTDQKLAQL